MGFAKCFSEPMLIGFQSCFVLSFLPNKDGSMRRVFRGTAPNDKLD